MHTHLQYIGEGRRYGIWGGRMVDIEVLKNYWITPTVTINGKLNGGNSSITFEVWGEGPVLSPLISNLLLPPPPPPPPPPRNVKAAISFCGEYKEL